MSRNVNKAFQNDIAASVTEMVAKKFDKVESGTPSNQITVGDLCDRMLDVICVYSALMLRDLMIVSTLEGNPEMAVKFLESLPGDFLTGIDQIGNFKEEVAELLTTHTSKPTSVH